jgi:hypothetical protein
MDYREEIVGLEDKDVVWGIIYPIKYDNLGYKIAPDYLVYAYEQKKQAQEELEAIKENDNKDCKLYKFDRNDLPSEIEILNFQKD